MGSTAGLDQKYLAHDSENLTQGETIMKKLAVIAIAGVLTLSACTENQGQTAGELLMFSVAAGGIVCGAAQIC